MLVVMHTRHARFEASPMNDPRGPGPLYMCMVGI
jgi:hypothetical protein